MNRYIGISGLILLSSCCFTAPPAHADFIFFGADVAKESTWSGGYAGLNAGYAWAPSVSTGGDSFGLPSDASTGLAPGGAFFGGEAGYNWQGLLGPGDRSVFGVAADLQGGSIESDAVEANFGDRLHSSLDWFGTLRARAGYAPSELTFFYATGGLAFGAVNKSISGPNPALGGATFRFDEVAAGFVYGGGVEIKFTPALAFKFEFQAFDLGKNEPVNAAGAGLTSVGGRIKEDQFSTLRVGLSYYFGEGGLYPLK